MHKIYLIPERNNISGSEELSRQYGTGWEFDDFFEPEFLADSEKADCLINKYIEADMPYDRTLHGAFFDITVFSTDPDVRAVSDKRVRQSLDFARRLKASKVIFHTNYLPTFDSEPYKVGWINDNEKYWRRICDEYKDLTILMENMFDLTPELIVKLAERLKDVSNFGICFDYAHAIISGNPIREWAMAVAPYTKHIHVNDNDLKKDLHEVLGEGSIDFNEFADIVKNLFPDTSILLELRGIEGQRKSVQFINNLL